LELFSLEREGRPVAGRPFRLSWSLRDKPLEISYRGRTRSAPDAGRSAATGLAAWMWSTKFVAALYTVTYFRLHQEVFLLLTRSFRQFSGFPLLNEFFLSVLSVLIRGEVFDFSQQAYLSMS